MKKPLLSVCVITYNQAPYIREAIDSLLAQRVDFAWQLIIADDYSTDGTREILLDYKKKHPELIHLILQKNNIGPEQNWLDLISYPKTTYLLYAEGDDYFIDPLKLQKQVNFLEAHQDFSACFHPVRVVYDDGSRPDEIFPTPEIRFRKRVLGLDDLLPVNFMQTNSVMYRWEFTKSNIKDVYPRGIVPGDWYLHLLHARSGKIGFIDRAMTVYRRHQGGIWWDSERNPKKFWRKYGIAHLKFYIETIKMVDGNKDRRAIVVKNIQNAIHIMNAIDSRGDKGLIVAAAQQVPEAIALYVRSELSDLQRLIEKNEQLDRQLKLTAEDLEAKNAQLQEIHNSRLWKARNRSAKLLGRKAV